MLLRHHKLEKDTPIEQVESKKARERERERERECVCVCVYEGEGQNPFSNPLSNSNGICNMRMY